MPPALGDARSELKSPASTDLLELQTHRETREKRDAKIKASNQAAALRASEREALLPHGQALLRATLAPALQGLTVLLAGHMESPQVGRHYAAIPLLLEVARPEQALQLALRALIDRISKPSSFIAVADEIGKALENEHRAQKLIEKDRLTFEQLRARRDGRKRRGRLLGKQGQRAIGLTLEPWAKADRLTVGCLLLELLVLHTGLVEIAVVRRGNRTIREVRPLPAVLELVRASHPLELLPTRTPMVVPPRRWEGVRGGGHLSNDQPLVNRARDLSLYERPAIDTALAAVNHLQAQPLTVDPGMVQLQRTAWDVGIDDVYPVRREPRREPPLLPEDATREEWNRRNQEVAMARADLEMNGRKRMRIELGLQGLEALAGQQVWQAYCCDYRGRIYTANRMTTHQGPDYQKAALCFGQGERLDVEGFEWLLKAAAGHWGMSRRPWEERLAWGKENLERMVAAAADPIDRAELWQGAKDPWQFLQLARAVASWLTDPAVPIGAPVRLDQTTSGCGIVAALVRDERIGRLCNLFGDSPQDLYLHVAQLVQHRVEMDLHTNEHRAVRAMAAFWLKDGIGRSLVKTPVLAVPFGGTAMSTEEAMAKEAEVRVGYVPDLEVAYRCTMPARYLARHIRVVITEELASIKAIERWMRRVVDAALKQQQPVRWSCPSGWPMALGERTPTTVKVQSVLLGATRYQGEEVPPDGELSAKMTRPAATANLIHSLDGAFCQSIACTSAEHGWPLLTNHDCFATTANHATRLQQALARQMATTYQGDLLGQLAAEIQARAGLKTLPRPPMVGTLDPARIGESLYGFT